MREAYRKQKHIVYSSLQAVGKQAALHFIFTGRQLPNQPYAHGKISDLIQRFCVELSRTNVSGPENLSPGKSSESAANQ